MKKVLSLIAVVAILVLISCSDDPVSTTSSTKESSVFLVNERGDIGTLSRINKDLTIDNDIVNTGKWASDIKFADNKIFVVLSGDDYIKVVNATTLNDQDAYSIEMSEVGVTHPNKIVIYNGKAYITSTTGGVEIFNLSSKQFETKIKIPGGRNGTGAIAINGGYIYVDRNGYGYDATAGGYTYDKEYVFKINAQNNQIVDSVETGLNAKQMLFDNENDMHVLCAGNWGDVKGSTVIVNHSSFDEEKTLSFGVGVGGFDINSQGMVYVAMSDYDASWNANCGIMKYNSITNEMVNDAQNLIFEAPYAAMSFFIDKNDKMYLPFYKTDSANPENPDSLKVFENESVVKTLETGNGPQMMVEVEL